MQGTLEFVGWRFSSSHLFVSEILSLIFVWVADSGPPPHHHFLRVHFLLAAGRLNECLPESPLKSAWWRFWFGNPVVFFFFSQPWAQLDRGNIQQMTPFQYQFFISLASSLVNRNYRTKEGPESLKWPTRQGSWWADLEKWPRLEMVWRHLSPFKNHSMQIESSNSHDASRGRARLAGFWESTAPFHELLTLVSRPRNACERLEVFD